MEDCIRTVERINPKINAVLTKLFDVEKARARARRGVGEGSFAGVAVKRRSYNSLMNWKPRVRGQSDTRRFLREVVKRIQLLCEYSFAAIIQGYDRKLVPDALAQLQN